MQTVLYRSGDWAECDFISLSDDGLTVEFGENAIRTDDERLTNIGWRLRRSLCRKMLRRFDAGVSPVSRGGVTFTKTAQGQLRADWVAVYSVDERCFPPRREKSVVLDRAQLSAIF